MDRQFKTFGKYRWEITDIYGYPMSISIIRDHKISQVFDDKSDLDIIYTINLKDVADFGICSSTFYPKEKMLKTWSHGDSSTLRVNLKADKIEDCEVLIDMLVDSNQVEVMPVYKVEFLNK